MSLKSKSARKPVLSVVIPTLNEEKRIAKLLACLKRQSLKNFEVIVADANSKDNTVKIAKKWGAKVVKGGLPSIGRNAGAKNAKADTILFLDADVEFEEDFLQSCLYHFDKKRLGIAAIKIRSETRGFMFILGAAIWNLWVQLTNPWRAQAAGWGTLVKRSVHQKIGGYDEKMHFAEDLNYSWRATKVSKYGVLPVYITCSDRRFRQEAKWRTLRLYITFGVKYFFSPKHAFSHAPKYEFGNHPEQREQGIKTK